jgi:Mg-chelatase subunit ChlD
MKKIVVRTISALAALSTGLLGVGIASSQANPSGGELSAVGERAFQDITTCLTSGKEKALDVFYLVDNSGSLSWTDVDEVRTEVLSNSLEGLARFSEQGVKVSYAAALFNTNVQPIQDWTELTSSDQSSTITNFVNNGVLGGTTDWEEGLRYAKAQLESRTDSCKMLIWFTDGGINPDNTPEAVFNSLANLCRSDITASSLGSGSGFASSAFRSARTISVAAIGRVCRV